MDMSCNGSILMDWADGGDVETYITKNVNGINDEHDF
jgi:hypothetical protein